MLLLTIVLRLRLDQDVVDLDVCVDDTSLMHVPDGLEHVDRPALKFVFAHRLVSEYDFLGKVS